MASTWWALSALVSCVFLATASKLNVPRVLLPISPKTPINFTLEVSDGGCYSWSSSRPEVVRVIPLSDDEDGECSRRAIVTATGSSSHKTSAIVLAQDTSAKEVLRCDVIANQIHSLHIAMKTHELYIEDAPEEFYARAYDDQGNEFSSLEGLVFRWAFEGLSTDVDSDEPVLRWVKFSDSSYDVIPSIARLEAQGQQGHVVLIEGLRTGSARVSLQLESDFFRKVPAVTANIVVVANLVLDPPEVYLMPGAEVQLRLSQIRQGRAETIVLPSSQYYLEVDNAEIGTVLDASGSLRALKLGSTNVRLRDRNIKDPDTDLGPYVTVHVVQPHRMALTLLPDRMWVVVRGSHHAVQVEFFDEASNLIQPCDDLALRVQIPTAFPVGESSKNQTYHYGTAVNPGLFKVKATLRTLALPDGAALELSPPLKAMADLEIVEEVVLTPPRQVLTWDPILQPRYQIRYHASGGSESYTYSTSDAAMASISNTGVASVSGMGACRVYAAVPKHPHIRGEAEVYVLPALDMNVVPHLVEIDVGNQLRVPVRMTTRLHEGGEPVAFDDCRQVSLGVELGDAKNFQASANLSDAFRGLGCCTSVTLVASDVALTRLTLTLPVDADATVKSSVLVASYRPLRHLEPASGQTALALGSSRVLVFEGGPLPWVNKPSGHFRKVSVQDEQIASLGDMELVAGPKFVHKDVYQVKVTCRSLGQTTVTYQVGNLASSTNVHPAVATTAVTVICAHPSRISVLAEVRMPDDSKLTCPVDSSTGRVAAQSYLDLALVAVVKDASGRKLDNFESLAIDWSLSRDDIARLASSDSVLVETRQRDGYAILGRSYQLLKPTGRTGPLDVTAKLIGYQPQVLAELGLEGLSWPTGHVEEGEEDEDGVDQLSDTVDLIFVDDVTVDPGKDSLFNHPDNQLVLRLSQGSGSFDVDFQPPDMARVVYNAADKTITVTPQADGLLRIVVSDRCLWARHVAVAEISVTSLARIDLQTSDKIEQGSSVPLTVRLLDSAGRPLDASVLAFVELRPVLGSASVVAVAPAAADDLRHTLTGLTLGQTTVAFSSGAITSGFVNVQVFAPLQLSPRNITLVIGATFQVISSGGPQPDAVVEYTLDNEPIASCTADGLINALKLGHSKLMARAVDRRSGKARVYSQDEVDVHVISLSGIRISVPLKRVRQGSEMPVHLMGLDVHQTPFAFITCVPALRFDWSLSDGQSGQLSSPLTGSGLEPSPGDVGYFSVRFRALQPGHTLLRVRVTATQPQSGQLDAGLDQLVDEVSIQVYESLQLTSASASPSIGVDDALLMMTDAEYAVRTNLDSSAVIEYAASADAGVDLVTVGSDGTVRSGAAFGHASLVVTAKNIYGVAQSVSALAEVRPVAYMMLTAGPVLSVAARERLGVVPRGFDVDLRMTYHDALGRRFDAVRSRPALRPNRLDLMRLSVDADNCSVTVHADKAGQTLVRFYDEAHPQLVDYLSVDVAEVVRPSQAELVVGDVVCFSAPLLSPTGSPGRWSTGAGTVLSVDAETGVALAVSAGSADVSYGLSPKHTTWTGASVSAVAAMSFLSHLADRYVTNGRPGDYVFPLALRGPATSWTARPDDSNRVGADCSAEAVARLLERHAVAFECHVAFASHVHEPRADQLLTVRADMDVETGLYRCVVGPAVSAAAPSASTSVLDTDLVIRAVHSADVAAVWTVPFHPAVSFETSELHVSDVHPTAHLVVVGKTALLQQLQATASDASVLTLLAPQPQSATGVRFGVRFNAAYWTDRSQPLYVTVHSPLTGQRQRVPVHVKLLADDGQCKTAAADAAPSWLNVFTTALHFSQESALSLLSLLGTAAAIYIGYRALFGPGYRLTSDPVAFMPTKTSSSAEQAFASSPYVKRSGPHLWSVDSHDSPVYQSSFYQRSPTNTSPIMPQQHQSF